MRSTKSKLHTIRRRFAIGLLASLLCCAVASISGVSGVVEGRAGSSRLIRLKFDKNAVSHPASYLWERKILSELDSSLPWAEESTSTDTAWRPVGSLPRRVRVGLALGGGIVRGMTHIGVLRALEENGVPIHGVAGTSMGAIIGGLYASGYSPGRLEAVVQDSIDWKSIFHDLPPRCELPLWERLRNKPQEPGLDLNWNEAGLIPFRVETGAGLRVGQKFTHEIAKRTLEPDYLAGFDFDSLRTPFGAMLTNMRTNRSRLMRKGTVSAALRGSGAFPLAFEPMWIDGTPYIDGGILDNLPVDAFIAFDSTRAPPNRMRFDGTDYHYIIAVYPSSMDTSADSAEIPELSGPLGIPVLQKAFSLAREYHVRNSWSAAHGRICIDATGEFDFRAEKFTEVIAKGDSATRCDILCVKRGIAQKEDSLRSLEPGLARLPDPVDRVKLVSSIRIQSSPGEELDTAAISLAIRLRPGSYAEDVDVCEALRRVRYLDAYQRVEAVVEENDASIAVTFHVEKKPRGSLSIAVNLGHMEVRAPSGVEDLRFRLDSVASTVERTINRRESIPGFLETRSLVEKTLVSCGYIAPRIDSVQFRPRGEAANVIAGTLHVHGSVGRRLKGVRVSLRTGGALGQTFQDVTRRSIAKRFSRELSPEGIIENSAYALREYQLRSLYVEGLEGDSLIVTAQKKADATLEFPSLTWEPYEGLATFGELRFRDIFVADFAPYFNWTQNYPLKYAEELPRAQRFGFGSERCASCPRASVLSLLSDINIQWQTLSCSYETGTDAYHKALNELGIEYRVPVYLGDIAVIPSVEYTGMYLRGEGEYLRQGAGVFWLRFDRLNRIVCPGSGMKGDFDAKVGTGPDSSLDFGSEYWRRARLRMLAVHQAGTVPGGLPVVGNKPVYLEVRLYGSAHSDNTPTHECYSLGGFTSPGSYLVRLRDFEDLPGYQKDEIIEPIMLKVGSTARICLSEWSVLGLRASTNVIGSFHVVDAVPSGDGLLPMDRKLRASQYLGLHVDTSLLNMGIGFKAAWPEKIIDLRGHSRDHIHFSIVFYGLAI